MTSEGLPSRSRRASGSCVLRVLGEPRKRLEGAVDARHERYELLSRPWLLAPEKILSRLAADPEVVKHMLKNHAIVEATGFDLGQSIAVGDLVHVGHHKEVPFSRIVEPLAQALPLSVLDGRVRSVRGIDHETSDVVFPVVES